MEINNIFYMFTLLMLIQSGVVLTASIVTVFATMTLLRYARKSDELLDKILLVCEQLGRSMEIAIWRS